MDCKRLLRWLAAGAGAGVGAALTYRLLTERWRLTITRGVYGIRSLPPDLEGLTIAHLTDFHAGDWTPVRLVREAVSMTNRLMPDVVLLTGDYVDAERDDIAACAEALSHFTAPLGVYGVLGNHDYATGADDVERALIDAGITMLRNAAAPLGEGPTHLWIVGLDDTAGYRGDFAAAFADVPEGEPVILLSHIPDVLPKAGDLDVDLVLAGHTHGGQVRIPALGAPHAPIRWSPRFTAGSQRSAHSRMQVNRGVGMTMYGVRLNCPPEIGLFTLRSVVRG